jgi:eukaryotic-like serine/threonine-protein kinase
MPGCWIRASVLHALGHLNSERWHLLDALVAEHLKDHQGDPQRSLAALAQTSPVCQALEEVEDAEVQASLATMSMGDSVAEPTSDYRPRPALRAAGSRYRILRPHARGGLGEVYVAEDTELHREVALKEIQERHADNPRSRGRFVLEAEITGGLEHPGIVPVYGLGQYDDGRPYYVMRFIQGDNLHEAILAFHAAEHPGRNPGERSLALRGLLRRFLDSCNALAYAHSRGVLHRDIKPGNIMLGKYGETLVVDWGVSPNFSPTQRLRSSGRSWESRFKSLACNCDRECAPQERENKGVSSCPLSLFLRRRSGRDCDRNAC